MDRVLDVGGCFGLAGISLAVFRSHMAARCPEEPGPCLHGNDQLWAVPAPQDPVQSGNSIPPQPIPGSRSADSVGHCVRDGDSLVEASGKAIPELEAFLRY